MARPPLRAGKSLEYGGKSWKVVHSFKQGEKWQVHLKQQARRARYAAANPLHITVSLEELARNRAVVI